MPITHLFHVPNLDYPGVRHLHRDPDIIAIDHFASDDECDGLAQLYARSHGRARPSATAPGQEALRTSTTVFPDELEVRWLRERIAQATNIASLEQLEPTKLTRYAAGEYFRKHIDASFLNEKMWAYAARLAGVDEDGVQAPCSWPSRFVTLFLYLNDVDRGGRTRFRWLHSSEGGMRGRHARAACDGGMRWLTTAPSSPHRYALPVARRLRIHAWRRCLHAVDRGTRCGRGRRRCSFRAWDGASSRIPCPSRRRCFFRARDSRAACDRAHHGA